LRVGVLVNALKLSGWRGVVFEHLRASADARIALIIHHKAREPRVAEQLWNAVDNVERAMAKRALHDALARARGFDPSILDRAEIELSAYAVDAAELDQAERIRDAALDVIIDLSSDAESVIDPSFAQRGVWRLVSRAARGDRTSPLGFWDYYHGDPLTEIAVLARTASTESEIATACYGNFLWSWSMNDTLLGLRAAWLLEDALRKPAEPQTPPAGDHEERGIGHAPVMLVRNAGRLVRDAADRALFEDRWRIALSKNGAQPTIIESPPDTYWADPFVIERDGKAHLFFEEYLYGPKRGVISHVAVDDPKPGQVRRDLNATIIIDQPHHLSYPFLFTHKGELFMIPESSAANKVEVWRARDFPHGWTREATLLSGVSAADTSLLEHDGRWWLFTNIDRSGTNDHRTELHVFHAPDPIAGPWTPHAANPVLVDARSARMAGGFLKAADGRPIRCGQVQGRKYGENVAYRLITELTESTYAEAPLTDVHPIAITPGARTHHVCARDNWVVADECFVTPKWKR
jgi:hypothetical protein